ncbi:hypothetical protein AAG906_010608 [Vitis piasezkii]
MSIPPHTHHHHMNVMTGFENDHCSIGALEAKGSTPKGIPINYGKGKGIAPVSVANNDNNNTSDEDEPSYTEDENFSGQGAEEGNFQGLQKKGKWKTVSKIMISKGCFVSPQQCEDKFNDLNKRYKRLNEILGRELLVEWKCAYHNKNCHDIDLQGYFHLLASSKDNNGSEEEESMIMMMLHAQRMGQFHQRKESEPRGLQFWPQDACQDSFEVEMAGILKTPPSLCGSRKKQRFKWLRYSSKKGRDLENSRLENERLGLENERMVLELKQKELELDSKRPEASLDPASLGIDRLQGIRLNQ